MDESVDADTRRAEFMRAHTRTPDQAGPADRPEDEVLRLACLIYSGADGPERWAQARRILDDRPEVRDAGVHVAAALADAGALGRLLDADPGLASLDGGPFAWPPLLYLAYSRIDPSASEDSVVGAAQRLLAAGADPNSGYLHSGLPTPFTALTGAFGGGEQGPTRQPRHPHSVAMARVLLDAGADPNDGQALYNRMFERDDDHLELLFAYGLGAGSGGPWRERLGDLVDSPAAMVRSQLRWAVTHQMSARVELLVRHGVDGREPFPDGRTAAELAALEGDDESVQILLAAGAATPELSAPQSLIAAARAGDRAAVTRLVEQNPGVTDAARELRPVAILDAVIARRPDAVELLVELGFDVNAAAGPGLGIVVGSTALHHAAAAGTVDLVRRLIELGADPEARDQEHDATPQGWAEHAGRSDIVALLA
jgi:ankyrin repeat protein